MLGKQFETYITSIDHWIAFVLLAFVGGKMVFDALKQEDGDKDDSPFSVREIFCLRLQQALTRSRSGLRSRFSKPIFG